MLENRKSVLSDGVGAMLTRVNFISYYLILTAMEFCQNGHKTEQTKGMRIWVGEWSDVKESREYNKVNKV